MTITRPSVWTRSLEPFPWDWPVIVWDIAQILADHWDRGSSQDIEFKSQEPEDIDLLHRLKEALDQHHCEAGQVCDEVINAMPTHISYYGEDEWSLDLPGLLQAVAAWLRGNVQLAEASRNADRHNRFLPGRTEQEEIDDELTWAKIFFSVDKKIPVDPEWLDYFRDLYGEPPDFAKVPLLVRTRRKGREDAWKTAAQEYQRAFELFPSLGPAMEAAEILLLELGDREPSRKLYLEALPRGLEEWDSWEARDEGLQLASLFFVRAGREPLNPSWEFDYRLAYPIEHPRLPQNSQWRQVWLDAANNILDCLYGIRETSEEELIKAQSDLEKYFSDWWETFEKHTKSYLVTAHAFYKRYSSIDDPSQVDWGQCVIGLAKALEGHLRNTVGIRLSQPLAKWLSEPKQARVKAERMGIGDFKRFLDWFGKQPPGLNFLSKRLSESDQQFLLELQNQLDQLRQSRNSAAHAGPVIEFDEAQSVYRRLISSSARRSILVHVLEFVSTKE